MGPVSPINGAVERRWIETTLALSRRNYLNHAGFGTLNLLSTLVVREPEQLVLPEWAADGVTELVAAQFGLVGNKEIARIHCVVAQEFERISMNGVGPRLGNGVHHCAAELPVFGVETVSDEAEFFDGVQIWDQPGAQ